MTGQCPRQGLPHFGREYRYRSAKNASGLAVAGRVGDSMTSLASEIERRLTAVEQALARLGVSERLQRS
jgi:hypothetical protein